MLCFKKPTYRQCLLSQPRCPQSNYRTAPNIGKICKETNRSKAVDADESPTIETPLIATWDVILEMNL